MRRAYGYRPNVAATKRFNRTLAPFSKVCAALDNNTDRSAYCYRLEAHCRGVDRLDANHQEWLGACVGFGSGGATDKTQAGDVCERGEAELFYPVSGGASYALARDAVGDRGRHAGTYGSAAAKGIARGTLRELDYGDFDLRTYDPSYIQRLTRTGVPARYWTEAEKCPGRCVLLTTWQQARACLQNYMGIFTCSNIGYNEQRDNDGFMRRRGSWAHCMEVCGYRGERTGPRFRSGRRGFMLQQTWFDGWAGDDNYWPEDAPKQSFWITVYDMQAHLDQGDTYAVLGIDGVKRKNYRKLAKVGR